jgi:hypothetical protein
MHVEIPLQCGYKVIIANVANLTLQGVTKRCRLSLLTN